jgi:tRNA A-37 threonylcarbamoyl transferase component Bud32
LFHELINENKNKLNEKRGSSESISTQTSFDLHKTLLEKEKIICIDTISQLHINEGFFFKYSKDRERLKKYIITLLGKELFIFKIFTINEGEIISKTLKTIIQLEKTQFEEDLIEKVIFGKKLWAFQLLLKNDEINGKPYIFLIEGKQEFDKWLLLLKKSSEYREIFDHYEIRNEIGKGKYGKVKLGVHRLTKEKVAIKIINKSQVQKNDYNLIINEIEILKFCKNSENKHILRYIDDFENSLFIFIITEYLDGEDLNSYLSSKEILKEQEMKDISWQIATGIKFLHNFGIMHRDIKPSNIMIIKGEKSGFLIKITDFGFSERISPSQKKTESFGTISYAPPEILHQKPYKLEVDIWSFGVSLFFLMAGFLPFSDQSEDPRIISQIITNYSNLRKNKSDLSNFLFQNHKFNRNPSENLKDLILNCLDPDQGRRFNIDKFIFHPWFKEGLI